MAEIFGYPIMGGGGGGTGGTLSVTGVAGSTVTVSNGDKSYTRTLDSDGTATFKGLASGTWTVTMTDGTQTATETVEITDDYEATLSYAKIYGISRVITVSSPLWTRTDDAVGKSATASVGTVAGSSDFDDCYPWSGITRETLSTGDVMVKIPKFWYRRYRSGNVEYIKIADKATDGFELHPAFLRAGTTYDYIYVGAYKTTAGHYSKTGLAPLVNLTRGTFRTNAQNKGTGWGIIDIAALSAIQMLILVEFANNNVQNTIGAGVASGSTVTGTCDAVPNLTGHPAGTNGQVDVVWRGIEGFWGNTWEWTDGLNWNNGVYYVSNNPATYADDTATTYQALGYQGATNWSTAYITKLGLDSSNPWVMMPSDAGDGSESTYYADGAWSSTAWCVFRRSGSAGWGNSIGLFAAAMNFTSSVAPSWTPCGSRLMYLPA